MKRLLFLLTVCLAALPISAQSQHPASHEGKTTPDTKKQQDAQSHQDEDDGQRLFEANCSRCHNAPEGFSPRISGTIVRHMRVRASLSAHDEQELLRFFNP